MAQKRTYPGIHNDHYAGMTEAGRIIRDAWVFGILSEDETCEGWDYGRLNNLHQQVSDAWEPYDHMVGNLPDHLRERHQRLHQEAIARAKELGWAPDHSIDEE